MQVKQGDIYGFIGRNGAGKSTVMKMVAGLAKPTSGEIRLFGKEADASDPGDRIGALIESPGLYPKLSAFENLMLKALALGVPDAKVKANHLIGEVGLLDAGKMRTGGYSMGMKQRLGIALALIGDPDILILDEPLNGLDPEGTREMRELLKRINSERGVTIFISSHLLGQLEKMATRFGIIRNGTMVREITLAELEEECQDHLSVTVAEPSIALALLEEAFPQAQFRVHPDGTILATGIKEPSLIGDALSKQKIAVHGLQTHRRDLEDFFVELMGAESHV